MKKEERINIRCEAALRRGLEKKADKKGMPYADFIRWALRKEIEDDSFDKELDRRLEEFSKKKQSNLDKLLDKD